MAWKQIQKDPWPVWRETAESVKRLGKQQFCNTVLGEPYASTVASDNRRDRKSDPCP